MNRITRTLAAIGTGLAVAFGGVVASTPAVADTPSPNFVTKAEYRKVNKGMKIERVHRIFFRGSKVNRGGNRYPLGRRKGKPAEVRHYRVKSSRAYERYAAANGITEPGPGGVHHLPQGQRHVEGRQQERRLELVTRHRAIWLSPDREGDHSLPSRSRV